MESKMAVHWVEWRADKKEQTKAAQMECKKAELWGQDLVEHLVASMVSWKVDKMVEKLVEKKA